MPYLTPHDLDGWLKTAWPLMLPRITRLQALTCLEIDDFRSEAAITAFHSYLQVWKKFGSVNKPLFERYFTVNFLGACEVLTKQYGNGGGDGDGDGDGGNTPGAMALELEQLCADELLRCVAGL